MFSPKQRSTLQAAARTIVPHAYLNRSDASDLAALVEERLRTAPPHVQKDIALVLTLLGNVVVGALVARTLTPFAQLDDAARAEAFARWGRSRIPVARTAYQAIRRLVLSTHYGTPDGLSDMGVRPPLHTRAPELAWEGPAEGDATRDAEAVERSPNRRIVPRANPQPRPVPLGITLGSTLTGDVRLTADVVIVGSGAGGSVAAAHLAEAGREVILLEEGEYVPPDELNEIESELMPRLFADQCYRATDDAAFSILQGATVGGGTTVNWMVMLRTPDHVLEEWGRRFGLTDFSPARMAPIFDRIEREVHARPVPDDAHSPANRVILDGANKLGWRASASLINAKGCVRAGTCSLGCRYEAKQGTLQTYLPRAFAKGARLFTDTGVSRVEVIERDTGNGAMPRKRVHATVRDRITGAPRATLTVDAPLVILAGGAVGTPSILQRSGFAGGAVGQFLRLHPTSVVFGVYNRELYPFAGAPLSATCDHFNQRDDRGYGFWIQIPGLQPALASAATPGFGAAHRERMKKIRNCAPLITLVRDGSDVERSSGSVTVDKSGRVKLRYRLGPRDTANMRAALAAGARLHLANGAAEIMTLHDTPVLIRSERDLAQLETVSMAPNDLSMFSAHVNGTCRMGTNPAISGATPDGQRRGVRGLYVFDGSLLPTGLGVNPQETIMGIVTVLTERLLAH